MNIRSQSGYWLTRTFALLFGLALIIYLSIAFYFSGLIVSPSSAHEDIVAIQNLENKTGKPIQLIFTSRDNARFDAWYFERFENAPCAIIFTHGWNGSRIDMDKFMQAMHDTRCNFVSHDLRGHGTHEAILSTGGIIEKEELIQISRYLIDQFNFTENQIGLYGISLGASTSLQAAEHFEFAFIIADSPFKDWHTAIFERGTKTYGEWVLLFRPAIAWFIKLRANVNYTDASVLNTAKHISSPTLLIHSLSDTDTSPDQSSEIYEHLSRHNSQLLLTDWGAAHGKDIDLRPDEYRTILTDFVRRFNPSFISNNDGGAK